MKLLYDEINKKVNKTRRVILDASEMLTFNFLLLFIYAGIEQDFFALSREKN